jgi:hypothetical protein
MTAQEQAAVLALLGDIQKSIQKQYSPDGYNIGVFRRGLRRTELLRELLQGQFSIRSRHLGSRMGTLHLRVFRAAPLRPSAPGGKDRPIAVQRSLDRSVRRARRLQRFGMVSDRELYSRTTAMVVAYYGEADLARILDVNVTDLHLWATGGRRPPRHLLLRIVDLANAAAKQVREGW